MWPTGTIVKWDWDEPGNSYDYGIVTDSEEYGGITVTFLDGDELYYDSEELSEVLDISLLRASSIEVARLRKDKRLDTLKKLLCK